MSTEETIRTTPWGDVQLLGLGWQEGGRDVVMRLLGPDGVDRTLVFRWAHRLVVHLTWPEGRGGHALTWNATFDHRPDGCWSVCLDFAGQGRVSLVCNEIERQNAEESFDLSGL